MSTCMICHTCRGQVTNFWSQFPLLSFEFKVELNFSYFVVSGLFSKPSHGPCALALNFRLALCTLVYIVCSFIVKKILTWTAILLVRNTVEVLAQYF